MKASLREQIYKAMHEKNAIQRQIARRLFSPLQFIGFHLSADHFYDIVPNTKMIESKYPEGSRKCLGIDFHFMESETIFVEHLHKYLQEILNGEISSCGFINKNCYFSDADAIALYMQIREMQPSKIIEVGQGMSTMVILAACKMNWAETGNKTTLVTIDPYARVVGSEMKAEWIETEIIRSEVQSIDTSIFRTLKENDLLFIDSSHVFKFGSDVEYEFENIYPEIAKNVLIHIHDIFSPYEYPKSWQVKRKQFWNEQYHLEQFMRFNSNYTIVQPIHMLIKKSDLVKKFFSEKLSHIGFSAKGQSFYIRRVQ